MGNSFLDELLAGSGTELAQELMKLHKDFSAVPVNAKTYVSALLGSRSGPSLADFTDSDLAVMRQTVRTAMQQNGGRPSGSFGYGQYRGGKREAASEIDKPYGMLELAKKSFLDPSFRVETTIGQGRYSINDRNELEITDAYDFNRPRGDVAQYANSEGLLQISKDMAGLVMHGRAPEALETLINLVGPAAGESKPYTLNLGRFDR